MENNSEYDEMLKNLNVRVSSLSKLETSLDIPKLSYNINMINISYGLIPLFVYMTLYLIKPNFAMINDVGIDGQLFLEKKLSHKKLFIATIIITLLIWISYFAYKYKKVSSL